MVYQFNWLDGGDGWRTGMVRDCFTRPSYRNDKLVS